MNALEKYANIAKVRAFLAKGMGLKEAIKAAYPDYTPDQVASLAAKMGGGAEKTGGVSMNALEKYAAKKTLVEALKAKAKGFGHRAKNYKQDFSGARVKNAKNPKAKARAEKAQSKAQSQAKGFAGLAGLAALGIGAKAVAKRSASKSAIKGTQSAAKRLGNMARKNKKSLAIGGAAVGGAAGLKAVLDKKKRK